MVPFFFQGLTAVRSAHVLDLFFNDFPDKYEEYLAAQSIKKEQIYKVILFVVVFSSNVTQS